jgi:hypothetical protein
VPPASTVTERPWSPRSRQEVAAGGSCLLARASAYAVTGPVLGALMAAVSLAPGLPLLRGEPGPGLGSGDIAAVAAGTIVGAAVCAIMGVAAGRSSAARSRAPHHST